MEQYKISITGLTLVFAILLWGATATQAKAQGWILLEARDVPDQCTRPVSCIDRSTLVMRNLLNMTSADRNVLLQTLNQMSTIRGLPEDLGNSAVIVPESMIPVLHPLPKAEQLAPLMGHPGVYFDPKSLDANEATAGFSGMIISQLSAAGVRFLSQEERENTPGRPTLSVRFSARTESAGCIIPFSVSMSITEETVMVRNPALKMSGAAWSRTVRQNLANLNYTPTNALNEAIVAFIKDWKAANP